MLNMKSLLFSFLIMGLLSPVFGQLDLDFNAGTSKADFAFSNVRLSGELKAGLRLGASLELANYRYRFIDARPVSDGFAGTLRLLLVGKLAEKGRLRLDGFLKPGYRYLNPNEANQEFFHDFQPSHAFILEPGVLVTIKANEKWNFHTGVNMHMAWQLSPEPIFEQFPSSRLLAGSSYRLHDRWALFATSQVGPMSGASGDSEKFFWQMAVGLRVSLNPAIETTRLFGF
jgi:hypothetical protein